MRAHPGLSRYDPPRVTATERPRRRHRTLTCLGRSICYVGAMRKLIVQQWVTVDNIAAEEDGGLSFVSGEPFAENDTSPFKASVMGFIDSVDTMILGANTYAQSKDYWPN